MRIAPQLALTLPAVISSLALVAHGMPHEGSIIDALALLRRDDTANYVVYPKDFRNKDQATAITNLLKGVVSDPTRIHVSDTSKGTFFWGASLNSDNAHKVRADSNVDAVIQECTSNCHDPTGSDDPGTTSKSRRSDDSTNYKEISRLVKRDDGDVNSHNAAAEMVFISLPDQERLSDFKDFVYDKSAGTGVNVYIVDTGAGLSNDDEFSKFVVPNKRWIQATGAGPPDNTENDIKGTGHGTGVLAKAAGWKHGVAKRSNPVIVRITKLGDPGAWLDGVSQVYKDWEPIYNKNPKTATAVMNLSWGWSKDGLNKVGYNTDEQNKWIAELRGLLNDCVNIGLLPIAPSGNGKPIQPHNPPVDEYPQLFAYGLSPDVPNLMVVGGVGTDGNLWARSKTDPDPKTEVIKVYAPCFDITVPNAQTGGYRYPAEVEGVSYAAGTISGLGAYFLGLSSLSNVLITDDPVQRVRNLKNELEIGSTIPRGTNDNVKSLYNFADPRTCPPDPPAGSQDGDEVPCGDTSSTSGNTVVAIPNCFITTVAPIPSEGINTPSPQCSCQGDAIAGIGSGTVSGTTYSWCQTGGLPSGVPTEVTAQPIQTHPPATTTSPATVPLASQCIHVFTDHPEHTATCISSIEKKDLSTPIPDGAWTCISGGLGVDCFCEAEGDAQPCLPADQFAARGKRNSHHRGPEPTAAPIFLS